MSSQTLLDEMRAVMRRLHYAVQTESAYCDWVKRYHRYHGFKTRDALLAAGAAEVEQFLTSLAVKRKVAAATQNQALNAWVFLYKRVFDQPLQGRIDAARSSREPRIPWVSYTAAFQFMGVLYCFDGSRVAETMAKA